MTDLEPRLVEALLEYFRHGEHILDLYLKTWEDDAQLLMLAHKYEIAELVKQLEDYLTRYVKSQNAVYILRLAEIYSLAELKKSVVRVSVDNMKSLIKENSSVLSSILTVMEENKSNK